MKILSVLSEDMLKHKHVVDEIISKMIGSDTELIIICDDTDDTEILMVDINVLEVYKNRTTIVNKTLIDDDTLKKLAVDMLVEESEALPRRGGSNFKSKKKKRKK